MGRQPHRRRGRPPFQLGGGARGWSYALLGASPSIATPTQPLAALHRVFAAPDDVAAVAEHLVRNWRTPTGEYGAEWDQAPRVRATIERFRAAVKKPGGLWTGAE
ncbi:hypothetical protein ACFVJ4_38495 [Streptomyces sp. NPDC127178]|uniref:hypothetical protein n=1 Tax=unclassified Streptomyces TaxID=2593676 RepID=UPI0036295549